MELRNLFINRMCKLSKTFEKAYMLRTHKRLLYDTIPSIAVDIAVEEQERNLTKEDSYTLITMRHIPAIKKLDMIKEEGDYIFIIESQSKHREKYAYTEYNHNTRRILRTEYTTTRRDAFKGEEK